MWRNCSDEFPSACAAIPTIFCRTPNPSSIVTEPVPLWFVTDFFRQPPSSTPPSVSLPHWFHCSILRMEPREYKRILTVVEGVAGRGSIMSWNHLQLSDLAPRVVTPPRAVTRSCDLACVRVLLMWPVTRGAPCLCIRGLSSARLLALSELRPDPCAPSTAASGSLARASSV